MFNPGQTMKSLKLLLRFLTVGGLVLLLLIPLTLIRGLIHERQSYRAEAVRRVANNTAGPQQFIGPLRVLPWTDTQIVTFTGEDEVIKQRVERKNGYTLQMPTSLDIDGKLIPKRLRSGLYEVNVYEWHAKLKAIFDDKLPRTGAGVTRAYGTPYLVFGISDVRGLVGMPSLRLDGQAQRLEAGTRDMKKLNGLHMMLPSISGETIGGRQVEMDFVLKGTQSLAVAPIGNSNKLVLNSTWRHPSFDGYSPRSEISDSGFSATWEVSSLTSNLQARMQGEQLDASLSDAAASLYNDASDTAISGIDSMKVSLIDRIDVYTQTDRASKYGILFVVLTFVGFALFELIKRLPIHPLQYLLVGLALAIFFLLLLSLSEHIEFVKAYLISAAACIGLQFVYLSGVLKSWLRATGFAVMLTALYGVLYSLLISEDNALLMGSLLLFGILAAIMWITRKVDWYELGSSLR